MKIALVCKMYPTHRPGGMLFVCQDRARGLVQAGHEVHVLTTGRETHHGEMTLDRGVEVHHMPCKPEAYTSEFAAHCLTHCKRFLPDIAHLDSFNVLWPWWREVSCTTALTLHGFCWGSYFSKWNMYTRHGGSPPALNPLGVASERQGMVDFNRVIGISRHEHWMLRDLMGIFDTRLVYNPLPDYFFKDVTEKRPTEKKRYLLSAVSGQKERGFDLACRAASKAGVEIVVAEGRNRTELPQLIDECTALLLPTTYAQGLDLAVSEAIVRRRPVIATATGSYLREAELGGVYYGAVKLIPVTADSDSLAKSLQEPWNGSDETVNWGAVREYLHGTGVHCKKWLEAILG